MLADCHLHFEGALPFAVVQALAERAGHPFRDRRAFEARRRALSDVGSFLELFADVCRMFRSPDDYRVAAARLAETLSESGVGYAEIYVSPEIFARIGLDPAACLEAVDAGLEESSRGADCRLLLDTVRHWGPEAAARVLDLHERKPLPRVVGFGMGGDEASVPAEAFRGAYARARALGLRTSVHAGEWRGPESIREALDALSPERIDHGIAAAQDRELLARLAAEPITLWVAPTGNVATGAAESLERHPLPNLLEAGVSVALSADDPLLFGTTTAEEYARARDAFAIPPGTLREMAGRAWRSTFGLTAEQAEAAAVRAETQDFG